MVGRLQRDVDGHGAPSSPSPPRWWPVAAHPPMTVRNPAPCRSRPLRPRSRRARHQPRSAPARRTSLRMPPTSGRGWRQWSTRRWCRRRWWWCCRRRSAMRRSALDLSCVDGQDLPTARGPLPDREQHQADDGHVILQLVQEGKLALDDPISKYRPDVPNGEQHHDRPVARHAQRTGELHRGSGVPRGHRCRTSSGSGNPRSCWHWRSANRRCLHRERAGTTPTRTTSCSVWSWSS